MPDAWLLLTGFSIGTQAVTTARLDGYTLLSTLDMTASILAAVYSSCRSTRPRAWVPVALLAKVPVLFVARPKGPANTAGNWSPTPRPTSDKLNYGSAVLYGQLPGEQLKPVSSMTYT